MSEHRLLVDAELHKPGYIQAVDPGSVGPGKLWVDTSLGTGLWTLKMRNDADTAWESLITMPSGAYPIWNPDSATWQMIRCRNNPDGIPELYLE